MFSLVAGCRCKTNIGIYIYFFDAACVFTRGYDGMWGGGGTGVVGKGGGEVIRRHTLRLYCLQDVRPC